MKIPYLIGGVLALIAFYNFLSIYDIISMSETEKKDYAINYKIQKTKYIESVAKQGLAYRYQSSVLECENYYADEELNYCIDKIDEKYLFDDSIARAKNTVNRYGLPGLDGPKRRLFPYMLGAFLSSIMVFAFLKECLPQRKNNL